MKKAFIFALALVVASALPLQAGIDFTLGTKKSDAAAPDPENRYITDGDNRIYLRIPLQWRNLSSAGELDLLPDATGSMVRIVQLGGVQALPLDAGGLATLRKSAQAGLPGGAKGLKSVGEVSDLLPVFGWKSFEITFEYEIYGQQMRQSTLSINMIPGRVVQVTVTARVEDFDKVHEKVRKLMFGWFEPKRDLPPAEAREYEEGGFKGG